MTTNVTTSAVGAEARTLDPVELYRTMLSARVLNDVMKARKTQGKFPFYIGCAGHESVAAIVAALDGEDWLSFYYRDLAGYLQRTGDLHAPLRAAYSRTTDPNCHGRNMPSHYSDRAHHIMPTFSEVAGLAPFAAGAGWAFKRDSSNRIIAFFTGDGGAATNDFNAMLRAATVHKLPVLIVVANNHWAIMTEQQAQWAGDLTAQVRAMDAIAVDVDGVDALATYDATRKLVARLRNGEGPALMHLHVGLLDAHSSSTDIRRYRTREEIEETTRTKDPVKRLAETLVAQGLLTEADVDRMRDEVKDAIDRAEAQVLTEPEIPPERATERVIQIPDWQPQANIGQKQRKMMIEALNDGLVEIVKRDPGFFVFGQDVGSATGGVFNVTQRLVKEYPGTAISSALNEQLIAGVTAGAGMVDGRARCGEVQFVDYHQSATQTIRLGARIYYQSFGDWNCPVIWRMKSGSGGGGPISDSGTAGGGGFGHSNAGEQWFTNVPGLITICPSTPYDAKGLLLQASLSQSPVVFLERGRLYRADEPRTRKDGEIIPELAELWQVPDGYYTEPIGKARRIRIGQGAPFATIVGWGTMLLEAAIAATRFTRAGGPAIDVIDLRTLSPWDEEAVAASVRETGRAIVVTEEPDMTSFGRHIHSWIAQNCFWQLDVPPALISAIAAPSAPYNGPEETAFFPSAVDIERTLERFTQQ
ncbi:MAG TPA: thiamine pyrophosphate-dependent enzyme [Ktedonobacterales bacterium]|jgi:2-oxoisovalerate dehydrogenase E1 component|nr:thiamine pyrophosphate-dependent enzyme [Ktedonobacterales bacterium]